MSAIVGVFNLNRQAVDPAKLDSMIETLAHRGPHGRNIWCQDDVGLGHGMLWTTPESLNEQLPYGSPMGDYAITADARIDNREELFAQLTFPDGVCLTELTDSQLILAAYQQWGEQSPEYLLGDFAFAIWDRHRQELFCARDHLGVKPFHYYVSTEVFAFATEIKALFCLPEIARRLNEVRIGDFLTSMLFDHTSTYYQDILRLQAAHCMTIGAEGVNVRRYWTLDPEYELKLDSDEAYATRFRELFADAVRCRLRCASPVASMLSGGLDSSSIACMAAQIRAERPQGSTPSKLLTYSAIFDEVPESDERNYINAVVDQGLVDPQYFHGDQTSPLVDLEQMMWHHDEPFYAYNQHINWSIYRMAQQQGVRVILDGFDGDMSVSHGLGYMRELASAGRWLKLTREMWGYTRHFDQKFVPLFRSFVYKYGLRSLMRRGRLLGRLQRGLARLGQMLTREIPSPAQHHTPWTLPISQAFSERIDLPQRHKALRQARFGSIKTQRSEHYKDVTSGLVPTVLELIDRAGAASEIEVRFPFWDKRIVEYCLSLPTAQKMQDGWTRMILRRAMQDILPPQIQWRGGKGNLGFSFEYVYRKFEAQRLEETIRNNLAVVASYVDVEEVQKVYHQYLSSSETRYEDLSTIWLTVNLALWLQFTELTPRPEQTS